MHSIANVVLAAAVACGIVLDPAALRSAPAGDPDDPAFAMYKKAYELILRERWADARRSFKDLAAKYPDSEYRDDAEYWIAYSWRDSDRKRAMEAYEDFVEKYKSSAYFDDALADMDQLMARAMTVTAAAPAPAVKVPGVPGIPPSTAVIAVPSESTFTMTMRSLPATALAPMMKLRRLERMMTRRPFGVIAGVGLSDEKLDDATRLRLEALYAIDMSGEDAKGFATLRKIAVNPKEQKVLRVAAIEGLADSRKHDVLPVYIEIARGDDDEEMQLYAIDCIGSAARDKEKAFDALMSLYRALPAAQAEKRRMVFYAIAEVGNERAIDFLAGIARAHEDFELRREAIHYLSTIGGEKSRSVLFEILEAEPAR